MKKFYLFLFSLTTFVSFSQGTVNLDDPAKWTQGSGAFTGYFNHSYADGVFTAQGLDVVRNTTAAQDGFPGANGTYSFRLQNDATTDVTVTIASGGVGNFSFKARRWDASPAIDYTVEYSTDGGTNWTTSPVPFNSLFTTDSNWKDYSFTINSTNSNIKIRVKSNSTNERLMVDDFSWTAPSTSPSIQITTPSNGTTYSPETTSVNVSLLVSNFNVANGTGDGHIHYTINGGGVIMKYDTTPIVVPTTPGTYTIYAELVNNSHTPIVPAQNTTVTFTVAAYNVVANLAALRADVTTNGAGKYYQVSSNPVITYARSTRNQKYIQDATAAILIDDNTGIITTPMVNGDAISTLKGQTSLFSGVLQLLPTANATIASSGNSVTPQVVTAANIIANIEAYESKLVRINNSTFTAADGVATFTVNTNNNLNDGTSDIVFRTSFAEANYIGQVIPTGAANRVVLVAEFNGTAQVVSRNLADVTLSRNSNEIKGLKVYPNPAKNTLYVTSDSFEAKEVQLYDVLGKSVLNTKTVNNTVNISSLSKGVYVVKITEEGKTATRKIVVE